MLRFLVSRRALALTAVLIVLGAGFGALAVWQWDRAHSRVVDPLSLPTIDLDALSQPGTGAVPGGALARSVRLSGSYDGQRTYAVLERTDTDQQVWSMTPLLLDDGSVIPVVHGRVADVDQAADVFVPRGTVEVVGRLQSSQSPVALSAADREGTLAPDPEKALLGGISTSELAGLVEEPIRPGFVVAASQSPSVVGIQRLGEDALVVPAQGLRLQNLLYTVQWSLFTAFIFFVYWRFMRDAWRDWTAAQNAAGSDQDLRADSGTSTKDPHHMKETTA